MSQAATNSFLPSGALTSSLTTVHTPSYMSPSTLSLSTYQSPISPPKTRSASADYNSAALIEDWRAYTQKLRCQFQGEHAHLRADRDRMEEVMEIERELWNRERIELKARIVELEMALIAAEANLRSAGRDSQSSHLKNQPCSSSSTTYPNVTVPPPTTAFIATTTRTPYHSLVSPQSGIRSLDDSVSSRIPQESGRNADGSPFYAPAPLNPSRTFEPTSTSELRVDDLMVPIENAIRVTSKELTSSDFIKQPNQTFSAAPLVPEMIPEAIDISHIQPELEGVAIRVSAVDPTFAAKVLSPQRSPPTLSPDFTALEARKGAPRDMTNRIGDRSVSGEIRTLEVVSQPENRRLTMHAGHTPNHSISRLPFLNESGNATPTQAHHPLDDNYQSGYLQDSTKTNEEEDQELAAPLGLTNQPESDEAFLLVLTEKLAEEARKSEDASPNFDDGPDEETSMSELHLSPPMPSSRDSGDDGREREFEKDGPLLRLKPSLNFGRPLGRM